MFIRIKALSSVTGGGRDDRLILLLPPGKIFVASTFDEAATESIGESGALDVISKTMVLVTTGFASLQVATQNGMR